MKGRRWTTEEDAFLCEHYHSMTPAKMSVVLERATTAIRTRLRKLELTQKGVEFECRFCGVTVHRSFKE